LSPTEYPLAGITVVEICHSVAGPYAGSILAQLGAEVLKIENPPNGDHSRAWGPPYWHDISCSYQCLNRDKSGLTANFKLPEDVENLQQLILDRVDVVIQNIKPGSIERSSIGSKALLAAKPSLIYCNLSAFGSTGPLALKPGYDPLMQAFGGLMSVTGERHGNPVRVGPAVIDLGSGMWAVIGILAALQRRANTGIGGVVDTSLFETALAWMTIPLTNFMATGELSYPMGSGISEIVPHQAFQVSDGYLMVAAGNDGLFKKLCSAISRDYLMQDGRYASNEGRVRNRESLIKSLETRFQEESKDYWMAQLDHAGVPNAPMQNVEQVLNHPQTKALNIVQDLPNGEMRLPGLPLSFDGVRPGLRRKAPTIGQDNPKYFKSSSSLAN
jgi:crotonobetainyl-CoA:carnitine CoA-transferase CaiB-like acyl-CoA transferase